jgi:dTDP-4-dehydrorhamnose reductase
VTSWHAYASEAIAYAQQQGATHALNINNILPIPSSAYPLPAKRPYYSVLNTEKLQKCFGVDVPVWTNVVHDVLDELNLQGQLN